VVLVFFVMGGSRIRGGWCPQRKKMVGAAVGVEAWEERDRERERRRLELGTWNLEWVMSV
jgi:hypothetical protein